MTRFTAETPQSNDGLAQMMAASDAAARSDVIDLALGDPDLDTDPQVIEAAFQDARSGHTHYAPPLGDADLLHAIALAWHEDYGVELAAGEVMVTTSGCHGMWLLLSAILNVNDEVVVFSPHFPPYVQQIKLAGGIPRIIETHPDAGFIPDPCALRDALNPRTKAVILNTPCNPTGTCLSRDLMQKLLSICIAADVLLIADDIYTAYSFNTPFTAFAQLSGAQGHVATVKSFSKDYCMSGWRLGYAVAPSNVIAAMRRINENNVFVAPTISQRAARCALVNRKRIRGQVSEVYGARMTYAIQRLNAIEGVHLRADSGSLYAFVDIRDLGLSSQEFTQRLLKANVAVIPGSSFGASGEGFIRLALREDETVLAHAFDAIEQVVQHC